MCKLNRNNEYYRQGKNKMKLIRQINFKKQILCIRTEKKVLQLALALTLKKFLNILGKIDNIV